VAKKIKDPNSLLSVLGVGKSIAEDLHMLGIHHIKDLIGQDPETLYNDLCSQHKTKIDPCVLDTFRYGVYYAKNKQHDPALLK
jgi:predicted RecB family nuclease